MHTGKCIKKTYLADSISANVIFIIFAICFGTLYTFIFPPFQVSDEYAHFSRAYEISEGHIVSDFNGTSAGNYLPKSIEEFYTASRVESIRAKTYMKFDPLIFGELLSNATDPKSKVWVSFPGSALYSPVPYIPQAIGISIGKLFGLPIICMFYLGRLFNLLFWILIGFMSIKYMPLGKEVLFLLILNPIMLHKAASFSADAVTNGLIIIYVCLIFYLIYRNGNISLSHVLLLMTVSIGICLSKNVYILFSLLILLIPIKKFPNIKSYIACFSITIVSSFSAAMFWTAYISTHLSLSTSKMASPTKQLAFIIQNPIDYLLVIMRTTKEYMLPFVKSLFSKALGWGDVQNPSILYWGLFCLFLFASAFGNNPKQLLLNKPRRFLIILVMLMTYILVATSLYISFSAYRANTISGIQGRYFYPLLLPLSLLISSCDIRPRILKHNYMKIGFYLCIFAVNTISLINAFNRYYIY